MVADEDVIEAVAHLAHQDSHVAGLLAMLQLVDHLQPGQAGSSSMNVKPGISGAVSGTSVDCNTALIYAAVQC